MPSIPRIYVSDIIFPCFLFAISEQTGRWSEEEHDRFIAALRKHGKDWSRIALYIPTRTVVQIRTHAQKV